MRSIALNGEQDDQHDEQQQKWYCSTGAGLPDSRSALRALTPDRRRDLIQLPYGSKESDGRSGCT